MSEQNNVVSLEQEIIHKNSDIFANITNKIGQLLKQGIATFSFDYREAAIAFESSTEVKRAFSDYSPERVQSVSEELVELTLKLLDGQEQNLLAEAEKEGKTAHAILDKKINAVKHHILNSNLQNAYYFYRTCVGNVLEQFIAQRVVKPASNSFPSIETLIIKLTTKDNLSNSGKTVSFELYQDQLDDIIKTLTQVKKEFQASSND